MVYPALLLFVGFVVVNVMLLVVLPRFSGLFESLNAPLPPTTVFLMAISNILRTWWWLIGIGTIAGVIGMKIFGEGDFKDRQQRFNSLKYVLGLGTVQAFTIGFSSAEQIDETLELIEQATA